MINSIFILLKFELLLTFILFILLFLKLGKGMSKNEITLGVINLLLLINFILGILATLKVNCSTECSAPIM